MEGPQAVRGSARGGHVGPPAARGRAAHRGGEPRSYVRLGHDALAKVAAAWRAERERKRQARKWAAGAAAAVVLALLFSGLAFDAYRGREKALASEAKAREQTAKAREQTLIATSRQLAAHSSALLGQQYDLALLLAAQAFRFSKTVEARDALFTALTARPDRTMKPDVRSFLEHPGHRTVAMAFSPDRKTLATGWAVKGDTVEGPWAGIDFWDLESGRRADGPCLNPGNVVNILAFSPDGGALAVGFSTPKTGLGGVILWNLESDNRTVEPLSLPVKGPVTSLAFSPEDPYNSRNPMLVAGFRGVDPKLGGGVVMWDLVVKRRGGRGPRYGRAFPVIRIDGGVPSKSQVRSVAFNRDGTAVAAGCVIPEMGYDKWDGSVVVLWEKGPNGIWPARILDADALYDTQNVVFSPVANLLAAGFKGGEPGNEKGGGLAVWNLDGPTPSRNDLVLDELRDAAEHRLQRRWQGHRGRRRVVDRPRGRDG